MKSAHTARFLSKIALRKMIFVACVLSVLGTVFADDLTFDVSRRCCG
jgi:hypothetical protein